jgi:predicted  nucleic acid-binding Zn-ribbon protein
LTNKEYYFIIVIKGIVNMKRCTNCGREFTSESMKFCIVCGWELIEEAASEEIEETVAEATAVEEIAEETPVEEASEDVVHEEIVPEIADEILPEAVEEIIPEEIVFEPEITPETAPEIVEEIIPEAVEEIEPEPENIVEIPVKPIKKPIGIVRKIFNVLLSAVFGLIAFSLMLSAGISYIAREITNPEIIGAVVENIDILNLPVEGTPMQIENSGETVKEAIYVMADGLGLSENDIEEIYEDTTFRDELISVLSDYGYYIRDGRAIDELTVEEIKEIYDENLKVINRVLEKAGEPPIGDVDIAIAHAAIEQTEPVLASIQGEAVIEGAIGVNSVGVIRTLISMPVIMLEVIIAGIFCLLIGLVNKKFRSPFMAIGVTSVTASGLIALSISLLENSAIVFGVPNAAQIIIAEAASFIGDRVYNICGMAAIAGAVCIIISITIGHFGDKIAAKKAA